MDGYPFFFYPFFPLVILTGENVLRIKTEMILELTKLSNIYRLRLNVSFTTLINYFLALALILGTNGLIKLKDSHLCWFETSIDGCPFFCLRFCKGHFNLVNMY